jgi:hypothetical protein
MIDANCHGLSEHPERCRMIFRRAEYARAGKLHRAITHAVHGAVAELEGGGTGHDGHRQSPTGWASLAVVLRPEIR